MTTTEDKGYETLEECSICGSETWAPHSAPAPVCDYCLMCMEEDGTHSNIVRWYLTYFGSLEDAVINISVDYEDDEDTEEEDAFQDKWDWNEEWGKMVLTKPTKVEPAQPAAEISAQASLECFWTNAFTHNKRIYDLYAEEVEDNEVEDDIYKLYEEVEWDKYEKGTYDPEVEYF